MEGKSFWPGSQQGVYLDSSLYILLSLAWSLGHRRYQPLNLLERQKRVMGRAQSRSLNPDCHLQVEETMGELHNLFEAQFMYLSNGNNPSLPHRVETGLKITVNVNCQLPESGGWTSQPILI